MGAMLIVHNHSIRKNGGLYDVATVTHIVPLMTASAHIFWVIICSHGNIQLVLSLFHINVQGCICFTHSMCNS